MVKKLSLAIEHVTLSDRFPSFIIGFHPVTYVCSQLLYMEKSTKVLIYLSAHAHTMHTACIQHTYIDG